MNTIYFCFIIIMIICLEASNSQSLTENALTQKYLEKLLLSGYNSQIMPESMKGDGNPVNINCSLYYLDIFKVDEMNMEIKAQFFFGQSWVDQCLAYPNLDIKKVVLNDPKFIWTPDLLFLNEKEGYLHHLTKPNVYIGIEKDGEVLFSERLTMSFKCLMDFSKYPHDTQNCFITFGSFGFFRNKMEISWYMPIEISKHINLPFQITNIKESAINSSTSSGDYTTLQVEITLQRKIGYFITRLYVPFIFLTALSWISLWIPSNFLAHRLSLLMVIFCLMVYIGHDFNTQAPKTWYTKGSDVWIAVCQSLVFAAVLEFIAVHVVKENSQKNLCKNDPEALRVLESGAKMNLSESKDLSNNGFNRNSSRLKMVTRLGDNIDKISKVMFPVLFTFFNVIYWIVYCTGH